MEPAGSGIPFEAWRSWHRYGCREAPDGLSLAQFHPSPCRARTGRKNSGRSAKRLACRARVLLAKVPIALKRAVGLSGPSSSRQSAPILQQWSEQLPLSTAWMAVSKLAPQPVAFYAAVFSLVNATYISLIWELIDRGLVGGVSPTLRRIMRLPGMPKLRGRRGNEP